MTYKSFNESILMQNFGGDEEILLDMISVFQSNLFDLLDPIRESIHTKNGSQLKINAHTFKGVMSNFYAESGVKIAYELEQRGMTSTFDDAFLLLNRLEDQLVLFIYELDEFKNKLNQAS